MEGWQIVLSPAVLTGEVTWLDARLLPASISVLSLTLLLPLIWLQPTWIKDADASPLQNEENRPLGARIDAHIQARGGRTIVAFNVARLLGTLALAIVCTIVVSSDVSHTGAVRRSGVFEIALAAGYIYAGILSLLYLIVKPSIGRMCNAAAATVLLAQFAVFAWRNLIPFTTIDGVPADLDAPWLLWSRGVLVTVVGIVIPLFVPSQYIPVDPKNPMPVPAPEQTASLFSFLNFIFVDHIVIAANRTPSLAYDRLPPLPDGDFASTLAARGMDTLDPLRRTAEGLKDQHLGLGLLWVFRWKCLQMIGFLIGQVMLRFLGPIGINRLLSYLENDGADTAIRPWVWIACIFLAPILYTMFFCLYVHNANHVIVQSESMLVQLLLRHAFRVRVTDDTPIATISTSSINTEASTSTTGSSTPVNGETPSGSISSENTALSSQQGNTAGLTKPLTVPTQPGTLPISKEVLKPEEDSRNSRTKPSSSSVHLYAKINNMFGTDISNIGMGMIRPGFIVSSFNRL
ncbi:hypothetical protein CALVIDRAFT_412995 [Calocera viscosa TUFC12733]|uniref:Uncharacterized protein n=1 Tax=Calocera viscosa (strain TUFC12733) TaxID=1330018 RepID=A0A167G4F4_CALVF|nr:hypothetical protein CALVIDRAFT_412995 [Calocera viscosa TUFC12733]